MAQGTIVKVLVTGQWPNGWIGWLVSSVSAAGLLAILLVQPVRVAFRLVDARLEQAAATLGARPLDAFLTVALPLAVPGVLAGAVLCFSRSLGEFGATMAFVGNIPGETRTLPLAIYSFMNVPGGEGAAFRLAALSIGLAVVALAASHVITRRAERRLGYLDHRGPRA